MKVKTKISGGFRTPKGAADFARLRFVISSARKQGFNILNALTLAPERLAAVLERLDRFGGERRGALRFGLSDGLVGVQERRAQGVGPGLLVELANLRKLAQEMGVAEGVIDVFEGVVCAPPRTCQSSRARSPGGSSNTSATARRR